MTGDWQAIGAEAARCLREGRIEDGISAFQRLLALRPDQADAWFNLGYLQRCARRYEAALASYGEALRRGIDRPEEVHINRAAILTEHLPRTGEAVAELQRAIALNPKALIAWLNLGNVYEDVGDTEQARKAYQEALKVAPGNGRALARLAAMDVFAGNEGAALARLRGAVKTRQASPSDAAEICFALGSALDASGEWNEAFEWVSQGNRIARSALPPGLLYDRAAQERLVDSLIAAFPAPLPTAAPDTGRAPIFICGMFRSGSTLAEQMMARHSRVAAAGELEFIPAMVREDLQPYPAALAAAPAERIAALRSSYLEQVEAIHPGWDRLTDKRPDNFLHIGLIKTLFPDARIVHTARHPLDNILSVYFLYFADEISYGTQLDDIVHYYIQYRRLMAHWQALFGSDILTLEYERLVRDPRPELERLLSFSGLDWEESCLDDSRVSAEVRTASVWQVRKPLHTRSTGRWRNYSDQLAGVRAALERAGIRADD